MSFSELYDTLKENKICLPVDGDIESVIDRFLKVIEPAYYELIENDMVPEIIYFSYKVEKVFIKLGYITCFGMTIRCNMAIPDDEFIINCKKAKKWILKK